MLKAKYCYFRYCMIVARIFFAQIKNYTHVDAFVVVIYYNIV